MPLDNNWQGDLETRITEQAGISFHTCPECNGTTEIAYETPARSWTETCPLCGGMGELVD